MYTVYWEYVERARYFVRKRGQMHLGQGSEANAVARMMKQYGIVPRSEYDGYLQGQTFFDHAKMFDEIEAYLHSVKARHAWNEELVVETVRSILDHYMGRPPQKVTVEGETYTPMAYMTDYLELEMGDYVDFMSMMSKPFWEQDSYEVPDNWWDSEAYYNVPLEDFYQAVVEAIDEGYSVSIGGDVSEPGFENNVAVVPDFDIPSRYINQSARQMRFSNGSTTDDHAMHLVGHREYKGDTWFLVKDSGSGSRNCGPEAPEFGYYFFHEDYIRLKIMNISLHRDAAKKLLRKFPS
jgi:bleomycin hydrolase